MFIAAYSQLPKYGNNLTVHQRIMDKGGVVYIYNELLFSYQKEGDLMFATTWISLKGIMPSEISQREEDKYCMVLPICGYKKEKKKKSSN